jgi:hypothetical protein
LNQGYEQRQHQRERPLHLHHCPSMRDHDLDAKQGRIIHTPGSLCYILPLEVVPHLAQSGTTQQVGNLLGAAATDLLVLFHELTVGK